MTTVIYNCRRCKRGRRVEYPNAARTQPGRAYDREGKATGDAVCPGCSRFMDWGYLDAHHRPEVRCDARCTGARGFKCDCSCGGKNHGSGWSMGAPAFTSMVAP